MNRKPAIAIVGLALMVLGGCDRGDEQRAGRSARTARGAATASGFSESQAAQVLMAIDQARLIGAQAVTEKSENEAVLEFARVMSADHGALTAIVDSALTAAGQSLEEHPLSGQLVQAAQQFAVDIAVRDTGINNSYLTVEVRDHERALQLLVGALIPNAQTPQLKSIFQQVVPTYQAHLQRAREIQAIRQAMPRPPAAPPAMTPLPDTVRRPPMRPPVPPITTTTNG